MKRDSFAAGMALLGHGFSVETPPVMLDAYWLVLAELTDEQFAVATQRALAECKFMPRPVELRAFAGVRALADRGPEAWAIVRGAMDRFDYTDGVDFGPLVNAVVADLGGWQYLCDQSIPDLVWREKEFIAKFQDRTNRPPDADRGKSHRGVLASAPLHAIAAPGSDGPKMLESPARANVSDLVRDLAEAKS